MATKRVMIVGGGLAGLSAAMKLAELGVEVDLMSLTPVKRSHSVCAQGGINSVNEVTRQQGDSEWLHLDDTVYGGDFLQHQPPVKEMTEWAPRIIDLMDRLGVPFNRTPEGFRDQRRFGGTLFKRTAFSGATTGQQLLYALDDQVRRWSVAGKVKIYETWDYLAPVLDDAGVCRGVIGQDLVTMEIRSFPADAVIIASGGCGLIYGRSTMSMVCTGAAASRTFQAGAKYGNAEFIQVHPTAIPGADKLRLMSESARGEGGRVWVPRTPQDPRPPKHIPENERYYFLEERYPKYGNLVPRDIATREIFNVCTDEGLSVERDRLCVYLDLTHIPRHTLDIKLGGILEIYEKFQGVDPRDVPMKIFPAVHYSMGGLWVDYEKSATGGLVVGSPRNQLTNIPNLYAIGECDYQYHGANRLGANSLLSCIFSGLIVAPGIVNLIKGVKKAAAEEPASLFDSALQASPGRARRTAQATQRRREPLPDPSGAGQRDDQGRHGRALQQGPGGGPRESLRAGRAGQALLSLSDTGHWTNQNVIFTKSLKDMFPIAKAILLGAVQRDESRGAHFKPDFCMPGLEATDPAGKRREAEQWCDRFEASTARWLKSTIATCDAEGNPHLTYEDIDTTLIPPRPRLYGLVGAEVIEEVWKGRQAAKAAAPTNGPAVRTAPKPAAVH